MPAPTFQPSPTAPAQGRSNAGALIALALVGIATVAGFVAVLSARYSSGEGYPNYSTLRSDPLGARALFEALDRLPNIESVRSYERLDKLKSQSSEALVLMNVDASQFNSPKGIDGEAVQRWVLGGGRLIVALSPTSDGAKYDQMIRKAEAELDDEEAEKDAKQKAKEAKQAKDKAPAADKAKPADSTTPEKQPTPEAKPKSEPKSEPKPKSKNEAAEEKLKAARKRLGIRVKHETSLAEVLKVAAKSATTYYPKADGGALLTLRPALPVPVADMPKWFSNAYLDDDPQQDFSDEWRRALAARDRHRNKTEKDEKSEKAAAEAQAKTKAELAKKPSEPSPWRLLASKGDRAMILERSLGTGSVVVCSDSYFLSNEALWKEPKPKFLSWLIGDSTRVIFDETHLGSYIGDEAGIMTLARRYGMHGLFLAGIVLFGLFIWRSVTSLVPRDEAADLGLWRADAVEGRSSASGLEGLLRRGVKPRELLRRCFDVWSSTRAASATVPAERRAAAASLLAESLPDKGKSTAPIPEIYRQLRDTLHQR